MHNTCISQGLRERIVVKCVIHDIHTYITLATRLRKYHQAQFLESSQHLHQAQFWNLLSTGKING